PLRTGYSHDVEASYVVAADLKGAMKHGASMNSFLRGLEKAQEDAGQAKGNSIRGALYVGTETIQTAGGPQQMKVVYKRGVFQLLMLYRKPVATHYRDGVFDILEQIEREGGYISEGASPEQVEALHEAYQNRIEGIVAGAQRIQNRTDREVKLQLDSERDKREETQYQLHLYQAYVKYLRGYADLNGTTRGSLSVPQFRKE